LIVGPAEDVNNVSHARDDTGDLSPTPTFVLSGTWPDGTAESMRELYSALAEWDADAIVLVGALNDAGLQAVMIAASSAGASVYATRRARQHRDRFRPSKHETRLVELRAST